jgi:hypothetical protein
MIASHLPVYSVWVGAEYVILGCVIYVRSIRGLAIKCFFHPLAKYPGPLSYKLSGWPLLWQAYCGDRHIWHLKDHERYGKLEGKGNTMSIEPSLT